MDAETLKEPSRGKFIWVKCKDCGNKQIVFNKASTIVNCLVCGTTLAKPTGGKAELKGEVVSTLE